MEVKELCRVLHDKLTDPFSHADMNRDDVDWQGAYDAMRDEIEDDDLPAAVSAFLEVVGNRPAHSEEGQG